MKYTMKQEEKEKAFVPFSVTLTFETEEEYANFHDNVMGKITKCNSHDFHASIYNIGRGEIAKAEGKI
jgi:hypothetical protein